MKWIKDNGQEIELNELPATVEYAKSLEWKPAKAETIQSEAPKKKLGRPAKVSQFN
jgi:hypothetical protein